MVETKLAEMLEWFGKISPIFDFLRAADRGRVVGSSLPECAGAAEPPRVRPD